MAAVAIGHLKSTNADLDKPAEVIAAAWAWQRERGQKRWGSVWSVGMIGEEKARRLVDRVWTSEEVRAEARLGT